jgi:4-amino-4-deoxy-L-arabinose transferase-like glycosyltransferase
MTACAEELILSRANGIIYIMKLSLHWTRLQDSALIVASALIVLLPISPLILPAPSRDSGVFLYVGWRILNGEIPYLHIWDHKPPLIFYLNALGLWLTGGSKWGVWLIELAALLLAAGLGFKLVKRIFGTTAAVVSLSLWLASLTLVIEGGNLTTEYTLPLQFACLWLVARLDEPKHETRQLFAIGLLCGLIFWTKQSLTGIAGAIALYLTISRSYARQWHRLGRDLVMLTAGFAIPTIGIVAYFATHGALTQLWSAAFAYNFVYTSNGLHHLLRYLTIQTRFVVTGLLPLALIGYAAALWMWLTRAIFFRNHRTLLSVSLIGLPLEMLLFNVSGRAYLHYTMALLPWLAIFAGMGVYVIMHHWPKVKAYEGIIAGTSIVLLAMSLLARSLTSGGQTAYSQATARFSTHLRELTAPTDSLLLWGAETSVNFLAQRASPSRFSYQFPLYTKDYTSEALIVEFLDAILAERPRMIIDTGNLATPIFDFPITTPAIEAKVEAIQTIYRATGSLAGGTLYEPAPATAP